MRILGRGKTKANYVTCNMNNYCFPLLFTVFLLTKLNYYCNAKYFIKHVSFACYACICGDVTKLINEVGCLCSSKCEKIRFVN